jgi:DeoR family transcriptional regulator, suf operon transcriptional repressor
MRRTREKIMRRLLAFPGSTINDLAQVIGINGISIRHHLTAMEAEDLVYSTEERHGVGRPRLTYTLTNKGVEQFPTNYLLLAIRLLNLLKKRMTSDELTQLFGEIGTSIAQSYQDQVNGKSMDERMQVLKKVLTKEGFIIEINKNEAEYILTTLSCPYYQIGLEHPEICAYDCELITNILSSPVSIVTCMFEDAERCTYHIAIETNEV